MKQPDIYHRIKLTVTNQNKQEPGRENDALLLFLLRGRITVSIDGILKTAQANELLLLNPGQEFTYHSEGEILLARIPVPFELISKSACGFRVRFIRNPVFPELRKLATELILSSDYREGFRKPYAYTACYYRLLQFLLDHCLDPDALTSHQKGDERMEEILEYMHVNYNKPVSLQELADELYLSSSYLSRYFTRQFGMGFSQYLTQLRMQHVRDEIRYLDKTITQISYDNGFTSISLFNRIFKKTFGCTPSQMREQYQSPLKMVPKEEQTVRDQANAYIADLIRQSGSQKSVTRFSAEDVRLLPGQPRPILNIGPAKSLLSSTMQDHVRLLKQTAGFYYARFWGLFTDDLLFRSGEGRKINFSRLDRIFDYLLQAGMKPYLVIDEKPERINQNLNSALYYEEFDTPFSGREDFSRTLTQLFSHLSLRYGSEEMSDWKVEIGQYRYYHSGRTGEAFFFELFETAKAAVRSAVPEIAVGGNILSEYYELGSSLDTLLIHWAQQPVKPDFLAAIVYGYDTDPRDELTYTERCREENAVSRIAEQFRNKVTWAGFPSDSLLISEWNLSVSERNLLNDTSFRGAYILRNAFEMEDTPGSSGIYMASDRNAEHFDSSDILFGGNGLVSKDGILKPAAYAFSFLSQLYPYLLGKTEDTVVTTNRRGKYRIVSTYLVMPNLHYYMTDEDKLELTQLGNYFDETDPVQKEIRITDAAPGLYRIRIQRMGPDHGSALKIWAELGYTKNLAFRDIQYLQKEVGPKLELSEISSDGSSLVIPLTLSPNEFVLVTAEYIR